MTHLNSPNQSELTHTTSKPEVEVRVEKRGSSWQEIVFVSVVLICLIAVYVFQGVAFRDSSQAPTDAVAVEALPAESQTQLDVTESTIPPTPEGVEQDIQISAASPLDQVNPKADYTLEVSTGDLGPQLLKAGVIDYDRLVQIYKNAGQPLTAGQIEILQQGSDAPVVINRQNAYFWLNFFWALGLATQNPLLDSGPMMENSSGQVDRYASTGGWTLGTKPIIELYSSEALIPLGVKQQKLLEEVAYSVYRPCCNNPVAFPDCNHGMALLGVLELMAANDATVAEMFEAAKFFNAFWFPQQAFETAVFFQATAGRDFANLDGSQAVGLTAFSGSGFQQVHQWLAQNGLLEQAPGGANNCNV